MDETVKSVKPLYKIFIAEILIVAFFVISSSVINILFPPPVVAPVSPEPTITPPEIELPTFNSCSELKQVFEEAQQGRYEYGAETLLAPGALKTADGIGGGGEREYSTTNVQVLGVDEADIVKTDGTYIYSISGNEVLIAKAYPPEEAKIISRINVENGTPQEIFVHQDNVMIFGTRTSLPQEKSSVKEEIYPPVGGSTTFVEIWNTRRKIRPELVRSLDFEGTYNTSRKIDNYVYFVLNSYRYYYDDDAPVVPMYRTDKTSEFVPICDCDEVKIIRPFESYNYLSVISIPIDDYDKDIEKVVMFGASQNVYASLGNLYIASISYNYQPKIFDERFGKVKENIEETTVHKFGLEKGKISFCAQGAVPGHILNQFSMDEHKSYFRIATTIGQVSRQEGKSTNNVYVLDKNLKIVGKIEELAVGEKIYSARFMGDKGYLVTFKKVDPFFTLDLSDPENPRIVGQLKIPGYSDYLHPYDENHIIGLGKETEAALGGDFAWYQGIKIAIFDVSDFANPKQLYKVEIGDRGTDSYALSDHKAFLFDKKRNLLVIPILLAEIPEEKKRNEFREANISGRPTFQGAYVYRITLDKGFELLGRISHLDNFEEQAGYYYYNDPYNVKRSLYIEDYLYTVSDKMIAINHLFDLEDAGKITL